MWKRSHQNNALAIRKFATSMPAVIENQRAPVLMRAFARVGMLVKRRAVELRQRPVVPREMRRHPVHDHPDARRVQFVDEKLKILRRPVAARRREKAGDLIPPRRIIRMLRHRHEFHMREAHLLQVGDERFGHAVVTQGFTLGFLAPRTQVQFVNAHRRPQRILRAPLLQPCVIRPRELAIVPDDGGILRRDFKKQPARIGFQPDAVVMVAQFKFVMRPLPHAGKENFPNAGRPEPSASDAPGHPSH